jgi:hypothetical protein
MPCDSIQTNSVNLGNLGDRSMLQRALENLGHKNVQVHEDGRITFGDYRSGGTIWPNGRMDTTGGATAMQANEVKRAYSSEAVKAAAAKFGWSLKTTAAGKFQAIRRF